MITVGAKAIAPMSCTNFIMNAFILSWSTFMTGGSELSCLEFYPDTIEKAGLLSHVSRARGPLFFSSGGSCPGCVLGDYGWLGLGTGSVGDVKVPKETAGTPNGWCPVRKSRACFVEK